MRAGAGYAAVECASLHYLIRSNSLLRDSGVLLVGSMTHHLSEYKTARPLDCEERIPLNDGRQVCRTRGNTYRRSRLLLACRLRLGRAERIRESERVGPCAGGLRVEGASALSELSRQTLARWREGVTYAGILVLPMLPNVSRPPPAASRRASSAFLPSSLGGRGWAG